MAGATTQQALIKQLLDAEGEAKAIQDAKRNRVEKLRGLTLAAEKEVEDFKRERETKYQEDIASRAVLDPEAAMESSTRREIDLVQQEYQNSKKKTVDYIVDKVLDVVIELTPTQKQALKTGMA